ncbi:hypothetical protein NPA07_02500 [Mycoplasmopsis caviae]|uniref:ECM-binding protein homolog n=1 Tax=Mycoplasmopsis caviae TaxID=55603 RepID=A0ABY5J249_9BACT|nr:hypothetical protein [Mycoplasmopsis caviae]UUD35722.1 hypothetical protein NPA07_02500 [Mycoplasmopsis caviae]
MNEDTKKDFEINSKKLKKIHDDIIEKVVDQPGYDPIKEDLEKLLSRYNDQISTNNDLQKQLQEKIDKYAKFSVGHHPGNKSFLRKLANREEQLFFSETLVDAEQQTNALLSESNWLINYFDKVVENANELISLKDSNNLLIDSISAKESKFSNLQVKINEYKEQKTKLPIKDKKQELTADFIFAGIKLFSEDKKLWESVLGKFIKSKSNPNNSISEKILNNKDIDLLKDNTNLSIAKYDGVKDILARYFDKDGKLISNEDVKRSEIISELSKANSDIANFNDEILSYVTNLISSLKTKLESKNAFNQSNMLDISDKSDSYGELYRNVEEIKSISTNSSLWNLEKVGQLIFKSNALILKEKEQIVELNSFINSSLKSKVNEFGGDITSFLELIGLKTQWDELVNFSKSSNIDFSTIKAQEYINQRDTLIDSFLKSKETINLLKDKSLSNYTYGKNRLNAFKTAYSSKKSKLNGFNFLNFSYSKISERENLINDALSKDLESLINANNKQVDEFLANVQSVSQLVSIDTNNFEALKSALNSNITDSDKFPTAYEFSYSGIDGYKPFEQLEDVKGVKTLVETKNAEVQAKKSEQWVENNLETVRSSFTSIFTLIEEINNSVKSLEDVKESYKSFLDTVVKNINALKSIVESGHANNKKNIEAKDKIIALAKTDYLDVCNKEQFSSKIENNAKNLKEKYAKSWVEVFKEYDKYEEVKKLLEPELTKYSHNDIAYLKDAVSQFIEHQHGIIEASINEIYGVLDQGSINWNQLPQKNKFNEFVKSEKSLRVNFVKNLYKILVDQFGYNTIYNFQSPKYKYDESNKKFIFDSVNILRNGQNEYANKTKAMEDAKKYESQPGLKPKSDKASDLYKRYGFDQPFYGIDLNGKNFNNEFLEPNNESEVSYTETNKSDSTDKRYYTVKANNWIYAKWNNSITNHVIGDDVSSALVKIKEESAPYILDTFFDLLNYENKLTHKVISQLKDKNKLIEKTEYDEIFTKLVNSLAKLTYTSILSILSSFQSIDNKSLYLPDRDKPENIVWNVGSPLGKWYNAGMSKVLPISIDRDIHNRYYKTYDYDIHHFRYYTDMPEGHFSQAREGNTTEFDMLRFDINDLFMKHNINVSHDSTHVISTSGAFQIKLLQSEYFDIFRGKQNIFVAFYNKLSFNDDFGYKFNTKHFDWWRFNTITEYKRTYGNLVNDEYPYLEHNLERHKFTDFFTEEKVTKLTKYEPVSE